MKHKKIILTAVLLILAGVLGYAITNSNKETSSNTLSSKKQTNNSKEIKKKGNMEHLTTSAFKEKVFNWDINKEWKYEGTKPAIIDFYADWCGPCKMVAPILEELKDEYGDKIEVYKVDTEKEQELASAFGIKSIPSILFIPVSGQPQMSVGALTKDGFVNAINEILLKNSNN